LHCHGDKKNNKDHTWRWWFFPHTWLLAHSRNFSPSSCATMWGMKIILWYQLCDLATNDGNGVRFWFSWNLWWLSLPQYHSHAFYKVWWRCF
jgi:hypothetical protein